MKDITLIFIELRRLTSSRKNDDEMEFLGTRYMALRKAGFLPEMINSNSYEDIRHLIVGGWVNALYEHLTEYDASVIFVCNDDDIEKLGGLKVKNPVFLISIMASNFMQAKAVVRLIRKEMPGAPVLVGGVHPTLCPDETFSILKPDYMVAGEADEIISDLVKCSINRKPFFYDGVWNKDESAPKVKIAEASASSFEWNWTLHDKYSHEINRNIVNYVSTRSCPFNCHFCGIVKTKYKEVDPDKSIEQMVELSDYYDNLWIHWENPCCFKDLDVTRKILTALKPYNINIAAQHRVEYPSLEIRSLYKLASESGLNNLFLGIETVQDSVLEKINKKNHSKNVEPCLQALAEVNIIVNSGWIIGIPGQTADDIKRDMEAAVNFIEKGLMKVALPQYLELYPGSWFWNNAEQVGIKLSCDSSSYDKLTAGVTHRTQELSEDEIWKYYCEFLDTIKSVVTF